MTGPVGLNGVFTRMVAGDVTYTSAVTHPRVPTIAANPKLKGVRPRLAHEIDLSWDAIPGATQYRVYYAPDRDTPFVTTPLLTTIYWDIRGARRRRSGS